jgi:predicted nucleotidyltransferase
VPKPTVALRPVGTVAAVVREWLRRLVGELAVEVLVAVVPGAVPVAAGDVAEAAEVPVPVVAAVATGWSGDELAAQPARASIATTAAALTARARGTI